LRPIVIRAGALGSGVPIVDMRVSRQHRILVASKVAERMFGTTEVLIPAVRLLGLPGVELDSRIREVNYLHVMFDQHEIIWSDGAQTESFYYGPEALKSLHSDARAEIEALFPMLISGKLLYEPVRFIPSIKQQKRLVERHVKNAKDFAIPQPDVENVAHFTESQFH
jgi:hypothetical protein